MRQIKPLSIKQIDAAKPTDKPYRLYDGNGLSLLINQTSKIWHFNYYKPFTKKRTVISLGSYPIVSLAMARAKRDEYQALLSQDIDPQKHRAEQAKTAAQDAKNTFGSVSEMWLSQQRYAPNTLSGAKRYLRYANQFLANKPIAEIDHYDIITTCQAIEENHGSLMASGVKIKISQVLDFAISRMMISQNIARTIRQTHKPHIKGHNPAITDPKQFAKLLQHINNLQQPSFITKQYLRLLPYLFVRPGELSTMKVSDIDFELRQWRYTPAKTSRLSRELIVPLSTQAMQIIQSCIDYHGQDYVFYSPRSKRGHISHKPSAEYFREHFQGEQTLHGLRASAKTILEEVLEYDPRFVEMQLGHAVKDMNGTAYNRAKYIKQRTAMMQAWADYLDSLIDNENG